MKLVFIVHYFPPLNSSGARRVISLAKYLSMWGHNITVITTAKSNRDGLLTEQVPGFLELIELNNFGKCLNTKHRLNTEPEVRKNNIHTRSLIGRYLLFIKRIMMSAFGQLLDHRLIFALQFASPLLDIKAKNALSSADLIISSCPPWPVHLAGLIAKKRFSKLWVADYRDQFSGNHVQILRGSSLSRRLEYSIEKWLLKSADFITVISEPMCEYYKSFHEKVCCIENGFDEDIVNRAKHEAQHDTSLIHSTNEHLTIRYVGAVASSSIPEAFLSAVTHLNNTSGRKILVEFYGESTFLRNKLTHTMPEVIPYIKFFEQLTHLQAVKKMFTADALLFYIEKSDMRSHSARGVLTTKLFEYLATGKPIVADIDVNSLSASYILKAGTGAVVTNNKELMIEQLEKLRKNELTFKVNNSFISSLSRALKAKEYEELLFKLKQ